MQRVVISTTYSFYVSALCLLELIKINFPYIEIYKTDDWFDHDPNWKNRFEPFLEGFLKEKEYENYLEKDGNLYFLNDDRADLRKNPILLEIVEKLGEKANSNYSNLKIVEIPDDVEWSIHESDTGGGEWIAEKHRIWY